MNDPIKDDKLITVEEVREFMEDKRGIKTRLNIIIFFLFSILWQCALAAQLLKQIHRTLLKQ